MIPSVFNAPYLIHTRGVITKRRAEICKVKLKKKYITFLFLLFRIFNVSVFALQKIHTLMNN
jgi:hypothetical protein